MSERGRFNSEQDRAYGQLRDFFGRPERGFPAAAQLKRAAGQLFWGKTAGREIDFVGRNRGEEPG